MDAPPPTATVPSQAGGGVDASPTGGANRPAPQPTATAKLRKRTKTGCLTCRKRRIKCGEERPICNNCIKSKRQCEGYNPRVIWKPPIGDWPGHQNIANTLPYHTGVIPGARHSFSGQPQPGLHQGAPNAPIQPRPVSQTFDFANLATGQIPTRGQPQGGVVAVPPVYQFVDQPGPQGYGDGQNIHPGIQHHQFRDHQQQHSGFVFEADQYRPSIAQYPRDAPPVLSPHHQQAPEASEQHFSPVPRDFQSSQGFQQGIIPPQPPASDSSPEDAHLHYRQTVSSPEQPHHPYPQPSQGVFQQVLSPTHPSYPPQQRQPPQPQPAPQQEEYVSASSRPQNENVQLRFASQYVPQATVNYETPPVAKTEPEAARPQEVSKSFSAPETEQHQNVPDVKYITEQLVVGPQATPSLVDTKALEDQAQTSQFANDHLTPTDMLNEAAIETWDDDYYDVQSDEDVDMAPDEVDNGSGKYQQDFGLVLQVYHQHTSDVGMRRIDAFMFEGILDHYRVEWSANPLRNEKTARVFAHFIHATAPMLSIHERNPLNTAAMFTRGPVPVSQQSLWTYTLPMMALNNQGLLHAMLSLGSLHIARLQGASVTPSLKHYAYALKRIHHSVGNPRKRHQVSTLAATLLLGFYELMTADHMKWSTHLVGAKQLLVEIDYSGFSKQAKVMKAEQAEYDKNVEFQSPAYPLPPRPYADIFKNPHAMPDEGVVSTLIGRKLRYDERGHIIEDFERPFGSPMHQQSVDMSKFELFQDLFFWYCRQDAYQSIVSGNPLLMDYSRWGDCPPRAPIGRADAVFATHDHFLLLLGRIADFAAKDRDRKIKAAAATGGQWRPGPLFGSFMQSARGQPGRTPGTPMGPPPGFAGGPPPGFGMSPSPITPTMPPSGYSGGPPPGFSGGPPPGYSGGPPPGFSGGPPPGFSGGPPPGFSGGPPPGFSGGPPPGFSGGPQGFSMGGAGGPPMTGQQQMPGGPSSLLSPVSPFAPKHPGQQQPSQGPPPSPHGPPTGATPAAPSSPQMQFYGMAPSMGKVYMPASYARDRQSSPQSPEQQNIDMEAATQEALDEWKQINAALDVFKSKLGPAYQALSAEYHQPLATPFGDARQYRSYEISIIWALYYMARIIIIRSHPAMPPAAMMAAGVAASLTAEHANEIGRITAGIVPPAVNVPLNPSLGAALINSSMPVFFAGVQYTNADQRAWLVGRLLDIERRTGFGSAGLMGRGCERAWERMGEMGRGPPYKMTRTEGVKDARLSGRLLAPEHDEAAAPQDADDRRFVFPGSTARLFWAMGLLAEGRDLRQDGTSGT